LSEPKPYTGFSTLEEKEETGTVTNHEIKTTLEVDMC
jgi:hypothetical protein